MQSQISEQVFKSFFQKLAKVLEQEMQAGQLRATVSNRFEEDGRAEIHLECALGAVELLVTVNHFFPKKEGPTVYCLSEVESELVDPQSRVVFY